MAELIDFQSWELPACRLAGKERILSPFEADPLPEFWEHCDKDGVFFAWEADPNALFPEALCDAADAPLCWCGNLQPDGTFHCLIGRMLHPGANVPEGLDFRDLPACKTVLGRIKGNVPDVFAEAMDLILPETEKLGLVPDTFSMEVRVPSRFSVPDPKDGSVILDYYIQVR